MVQLWCLYSVITASLPIQRLSYHYKGIKTCTEAEFLDKIQTKIWGVLLLVFHSHLYSFSLGTCFFKLTQPRTVSVKEKGGKPERKLYPLPYGGLRNPYRNLNSENSQDYAQKPQWNWNCMFMNSASGYSTKTFTKTWLLKGYLRGVRCAKSRRVLILWQSLSSILLVLYPREWGGGGDLAGSIKEFIWIHINMIFNIFVLYICINNK